MGDKGIKSSIELAMEKVAKMPKLTPEELAEQQEKEFAPLGRALALKLIEGRLGPDELKTELAGYQKETAPIVKKALLSTLKRAVSLQDEEINRRIFEALDALGEDTDSTDIKENIGKVVGEYQKEKQRIRKEFEREYRASLQKRGISGSSLRPNLRDARGLKARLDKLGQVHGEKLAELMERFCV